MWKALVAVFRLAVVAAALAAGWFALEQWMQQDRRAIEVRAFDLMTRALAPGSPLACLDGLAGETVEAACEKALFATPETLAAAVSYVSARLVLLSDGRDYARRADASPAFTQMRRATEDDRFGIVAHLLMTREGCSADQCAAFALVDDPSRISANIASQTFATAVLRHAGGWSGDGGHPPVAHAAPPAAAAAPAAPAALGAPGPVVGARNPGTLFFPSASSIPPVSIMNAEPGGGQGDTTGSAEAKGGARKQAPTARPQGGTANSGAAPSAAAPLPIAPAPPQ
jgi:hypothetical protein